MIKNEFGPHIHDGRLTKMEMFHFDSQRQILSCFFALDALFDIDCSHIPYTYVVVNYPWPKLFEWKRLLAEWTQNGWFIWQLFDNCFPFNDFTLFYIFYAYTQTWISQELHWSMAAWASHMSNVQNGYSETLWFCGGCPKSNNKF